MGATTWFALGAGPTSVGVVAERDLSIVGATVLT